MVQVLPLLPSIIIFLSLLLWLLKLLQQILPQLAQSLVMFTTNRQQVIILIVMVNGFTLLTAPLMAQSILTTLMEIFTFITLNILMSSQIVSHSDHYSLMECLDPQGSSIFMNTNNRESVHLQELARQPSFILTIHHHQVSREPLSPFQLLK